MKNILKLFKIESIRKSFTNNSTAKLVSIGVALVLWIVVASSQGTLGKLPGKITIKAINVADEMVAVYDQKDVEVQILADPQIWEELSVSSFAAYVDLAGLGEGTYELDVQVSTTVKDVQIVTKTPNKILVSIEKLVLKDVSINTKIEGSAGEGLVAGNIELVPSVVSVSGPESIVENITEATAPILLNGEEEDYEQIITLVAYSDNGEVIDNITFNPDQVLAKVSIVKASNNKTVGVKVNTSGSPAENYFISKITVLPNTIDLTGPNSVLQTVNYIETESIDISNITENLGISARLVIPRGTALQSGEEGSVNILFTIEKADTSKTISTEIEFVNIPEGLSLASSSANSVNISIIGSQQVVNTLTGENFTLQIDLSAYSVGESVVDISSDDIKFDSNISISSIEPTQIIIVLE